DSSPRITNFAEEATALTSVTSGAHLFDLKQESVAITVITDTDQFLQMSRCFALSPQMISASAPICDTTSFQCLGQGCFIHPRNHQDLTVGNILGDCGNQSPLRKMICNFGRNLHAPILP